MEVEQLPSNDSIHPESSISQQTPQEFFDEDGCIQFEETRVKIINKRDKQLKIKKKTKKTLPLLMGYDKIATNRLTMKNQGVFLKMKRGTVKSINTTTRPIKTKTTPELAFVDHPQVAKVDTKPKPSIDEIMSINYDHMIHQLDFYLHDMESL